MKKHTKPIINTHVHLFEEHEKKLSDFVEKHKLEKITKADIIRTAITGLFDRGERFILSAIKKEKDE